MTDCLEEYTYQMLSHFWTALEKKNHTSSKMFYQKVTWGNRNRVQNAL